MGKEIDLPRITRMARIGIRWAGRVEQVGRVRAVQFFMHSGPPFLAVLAKRRLRQTSLRDRHRNRTRSSRTELQTSQAYTQTRNAIARLRKFFFYFFAQRVASV